MDKERLKEVAKAIKTHADKIAYVGCILILAGVFLPFTRVSGFGDSVTESLWDGEGLVRWIMILSSFAMAALVFLKTQTKFVLLVTGVVAGTLAGYASLIADIAGGLGARSSFSWHVAFYIIILGVVACGLYGVFKEEKEEKA